MNKIITICSLLFFSFGVYSKEIYVISNPGLNLTTADVKQVYLGEKQMAGSQKLSPIENKSLQGDFVSQALGMDKTKYDSMWEKKSFQDGLNPPKSRSSDAEVIDFVKGNPGGIGYVSAPGDSKVIGKF